MKDISNSDDRIDVREVIMRMEELEDELVPTEESDGNDSPERQELAILTALLDDLKGKGGDYKWKGDWYPILLVRSSYFEQFAQQEAEDLELVNDSACWPNRWIDWERAAKELQSDYVAVDFDGETYWYR